MKTTLTVRAGAIPLVQLSPCDHSRSREKRKAAGAGAAAPRPQTAGTPTPTGETNWAEDLPPPSCPVVSRHFSRPRVGTTSPVAPAADKMAARGAAISLFYTGSPRRKWAWWTEAVFVPGGRGPGHMRAEAGPHAPCCFVSPFGLGFVLCCFACLLVC